MKNLKMQLMIYIVLLIKYITAISIENSNENTIKKSNKVTISPKQRPELFLNFPVLSTKAPRTEIVETPKGLFIIVDGNLICHNKDNGVSVCKEGYLSKYWKFYETEAGYKIKSKYKKFYFMSKPCLTFLQGNATMSTCYQNEPKQLWNVMIGKGSDEESSEKGEDTSFNKKLWDLKSTHNDTKLNESEIIKLQDPKKDEDASMISGSANDLNANQNESEIIKLQDPKKDEDASMISGSANDSNGDEMIDLQDYKRRMGETTKNILDEMYELKNDADIPSTTSEKAQDKNRTTYKKHDKKTRANDLLQHEASNKLGNGILLDAQKDKIDPNTGEKGDRKSDFAEECDQSDTIDMYKTFDMDSKHISKKQIKCDRSKVKKTFDGLLNDIKAVDKIIAVSDHLKTLPLEKDGSREDDDSTSVTKTVIITCKEK